MKIGETHIVRVGRHAIVCVTAREAARLCGCTEKSFRTYSAERRPKNNPAPEAIGRLLDSPAKLYPLDEVLAWRDARPGRGNWRRSQGATVDLGAPGIPGADSDLHGLDDGLHA